MYIYICIYHISYIYISYYIYSIFDLNMADVVPRLQCRCCERLHGLVRGDPKGGFVKGSSATTNNNNNNNNDNDNNNNSNTIEHNILLL